MFDVMFAALMNLCIVSSSRLRQVLQKKKREGSKQLNKENIIDDLPLCRIVCHEVDDRENDTKHSKVISCVLLYTLFAWIPFHENKEKKMGKGDGKGR